MVEIIRNLFSILAIPFSIDDYAHLCVIVDLGDTESYFVMRTSNRDLEFYAFPRGGEVAGEMRYRESGF